MILKRYGTSYQSVEPNFNPTAMTEVGFRRDREFQISVDEFEAQYQMVSESELTSEAEGPVQSETEQAMLEKLEAGLMEAFGTLSENQVLVVMNGKDDHPRPRERKDSTVVGHDNRFHFHWWVDPPLKVAVYSRS
ncbi:MAG: hypothetical protein ACR2QM_03205 [Longimicrobiales bacterium]